MELNVCLYCEKRLLDDNMAFCSVTCQSKEASKSLNESYAFFPQPKSSDTMQSSVSYQMSYHRSPSLSYTTRRRKESFNTILSSSSSYSTRNLMQSISSSTSFSSSISDISLPCSCEDKAGNICPPYHITRTT